MSSTDNQAPSLPITEGERQITNIEYSQNASVLTSEEPGSPQKLDKVHGASLVWDRFWLFVSSGLFFMLFGSSLLYLAHITLSSAHSSFTFVLVVVGVAILLYGTGTQGVGEIAGGTENKKYKAAIAGGAGLLAFGIGAGMILKHDDIQSTFQAQQKYVRVRLSPGTDDDGYFDYNSIATVDGRNVPTMLYGKYIEIHIPYLAGEESAERSISVHLYSHAKTKDKKKMDEAIYNQKIKLEPSKITSVGGGYEYPLFKEEFVFTVRVDEPWEPMDKPIDSSVQDRYEIQPKPPASMFMLQ